MSKLELESIFAKRITTLSKQRKEARKKLDKDNIMYLNGRIYELRFTLHELLEDLEG